MNKTEEFYQLIGNKLVGIIPDDWSKIYLYAEILSDSRTVYFYFQSTTRNELIFGQTIPEVYNVDVQIYRRLTRELMEFFVELNEESKKTSIQPWTNLTMYLDKSGKFNIDYSYDEVVFTPAQQYTIWKYEVLGLYPTDNGIFQEYLDDYLNNKGK